MATGRDATLGHFRLHLPLYLFEAARFLKVTPVAESSGTSGTRRGCDTIFLASWEPVRKVYFGSLHQLQHPPRNTGWETCPSPGRDCT